MCECKVFGCCVCVCARARARKRVSAPIAPNPMMHVMVPKLLPCKEVGRQSDARACATCPAYMMMMLERAGGRERGREREREGGREGGRQGGREARGQGRASHTRTRCTPCLQNKNLQGHVKKRIAADEDEHADDVQGDRERR